jgi:hypothetical protein
VTEIDLSIANRLLIQSIDPEASMTRLFAGPLALTLLLTGYSTAWSTNANAPPQSHQVERPQLVEALKQGCYSANGTGSGDTKAKCDCYARTFVASLTDAEMVPKRSAAVTAKIAAARRACHFGDF